jgi:hypothetical protein
LFRVGPAIAAVPTVERYWLNPRASGAPNQVRFNREAGSMRTMRVAGVMAACRFLPWDFTPPAPVPLSNLTMLQRRNQGE